MKFPFDFKDLCEKRQQVGSEKYQVLVCERCRHIRKPDEPVCCPTAMCGVYKIENAAIYRNCALDVAEELADAHNILGFLFKKVETEAEQRQVMSLMLNIEQLGVVMLSLAEHGEDEIPVQRVLPK